MARLDHHYRGSLTMIDFTTTEEAVIECYLSACDFVAPLIGTLVAAKFTLERSGAAASNSDDAEYIDNLLEILLEVPRLFLAEERLGMSPERERRLVALCDARKVNEQ